jgi:CheY-like chemotaxis protein
MSQAAAPPPEFSVTEDQLKKFLAFVGEKKILVADPNQSIRSGLSKVLSEMGVRSGQIFLASNFHEAKEQLDTKTPDIVICDYHLDARYGLELAPLHRAIRPNIDERLFLLVTGNSSESAVAEAAEEDVDAFILKPFTGASIRYYLVRAALAKANPSSYRAELSKGRNLLSSGSFSDAIEVFTAAMSMDSAPALACYYMGQCYEKMGELPQSEESYRSGLIFNEIHFRCSIALFDFYSAQSRPDEAYGIMKSIARHFPMSPQRLSKAIELAVRTHHFDDIGYYHSIFTTLDERRDDLRKCVCAALVVGAMYHFRQKNSQQALQLLQAAAVTASGSSATLREIVTLLVKFNLPDAANAFLKRFEASDQTGADYLCADLAVLDALPGTSPEDVIVRGRKLLTGGLQDPLVHRIMIRREHQVGHEDEAEKLMVEAASIWPQQADSFQVPANGHAEVPAK